MRKVTTVIEVQAHKSIARLQYCEQYSCVSLCARVRLYIGVLSTKEFLDAFDSQVLNDIHHLAAAVVALSWQTFCILVSKVRTHSVHHLVTHEILRSNQLHTFQLTLMFSFD